jgi:hypothetical protein
MKVGVPTPSGMMNAAKSGAMGAAGGVLYGLSKRFLGSGLLGAIGGILLAGSVVKGDEGQDIATVLGVRIGEDLAVGMFSGGSSVAASSETVM